MKKFKQILFTGLIQGFITYVILSSILIFALPLVFTHFQNNSIEAKKSFANLIENRQKELEISRQEFPLSEEQKNTPFFGEIQESYITVIGMLKILRSVFYFSMVFGMLSGILNSFVYNSKLKNIFKLLLYYLCGLSLFVFCSFINYTYIPIAAYSLAINLVLSPLALFISFNIVFFTGLLVFYIYRKILVNKLNNALNNK